MIQILMTSVAHFQYTTEQIRAWLRGLLTIAWADGQFDPEEQELMTQLTQDELAPTTDLGDLEVISAQDLAAALGDDHHTAENFLRTAVMMALANGVYSAEEAKVINEFVDALGLEIAELKVLEQTLYDPEKHHRDGEAEALQTGVWSGAGSHPARPHHPHVDVLEPVRHWLDDMDVKDPRVARFICKMVPPQCPFERDIKLFGRKIVHIPPMCKLNPLYEQLVGLRFRSLCYLADDCGEDVSKYC